MLFSGEIYTTGKIFTLPPAVMTVPNITSGILLITLCIPENLQLPKLIQKIEYVQNICIYEFREWSAKLKERRNSKSSDSVSSLSSLYKVSLF